MPARLLRRSPAALATVVLVGVTASWGSTFVLIKDLVAHMPVPDFLAVRFTIAAGVLALANPRSLLRLDRATLRHGIVLGLLYGLAQIVQTEGLARTSASVSGFITGTYVVLTPLFAALVLRSHPPRATWAAVATATAGLAVLSLRGLSVGLGESLTLVSAALYALHIVGLGAWSSTRDAYGLAVVQMGVIAAVCSVAAVPGGIQFPDRGLDWVSLVYMAVICGALALLAQTWAQAHLPPARAAIVMTMEPVWAAVFAVGIGGESLSWRMLLGGALVLTAMYVVELAPRRRIEEEVPHIAV